MILKYMLFLLMHTCSPRVLNEDTKPMDDRMYVEVATSFLQEFQLNKLIVLSSRETFFRVRAYFGANIMWSHLSCELASTSTIFSYYEDQYKRIRSDKYKILHNRVVSLILCQEENQNKILEKVLTRDLSKCLIWLLPSYLHRQFPNTINIPLDSYVFEFIVKDKQEVVIQDLWNPAKYVNKIKRHYATLLIKENHTDLNVFSHDFYLGRKNLTGVHFIVTSINDTMDTHYSVFNKSTGDWNFYGYYGEVWKILQNEMNFRYSIITPMDGQFGGLLANGNWSGLVGDIVSGRADVAVAHLSQTYSRAEVVDFTSVLNKFRYKIFSKPYEPASKSWSVYSRPFSTLLWLSLLITLIVLIVSFWYTSKVASNAAEKKRKSAKSCDFQPADDWRADGPLVVIAAFTQQGWYNTPNELYQRILFWIMYILGVVLFASYSAILFSFRALDEYQIEYNTIEDLQNLPGYKLGIVKGTVLEELFQTPTFSKAWNHLIAPYDDTVANGYNELRKSALEDSHFTFVGSTEIQRKDEIGACKLKAARQLLMYNDGALAFQENSQYIAIFDRIIAKLLEGGILDKLAQKHFSSEYTCAKREIEALGTHETIAAFGLIFMGVGLSLVILLIEIMTKKRYKQKSGRFAVLPIKQHYRSLWSSNNSQWKRRL